MKRTTTLLVISILCLTHTFAQPSQVEWGEGYREILRPIELPHFKHSKYIITQFGASTSASALDNQTAINTAIEVCSRNGGGRVIVPKGEWHTGAIRMQSGVNLVVEKGACLRFSADTSLYPLVETRWEGMDLMNYSPLVYAFKAHDVAITGEGTLDGGGSKDAWWPMCGSAKHGWTEATTEAQIYGGRNSLLKMSDEGIPVAQRIFGKGKGMRPQFIQFNQCERVLIEGVNVLNSPFWSIHPLLSKSVTVRGVRVDNSGPNGDGCNPESCNGVLIEKCYFNTGDDCIAIKSGRNGDGRRWNRPSQNIIVRKCRMANGHGGVVIGSEVSGDVKNVFVEDCNMDSPNLERVIRLKTNTCRGGTTENLYVRNIRVGQCKEAVLKINLVYEPKEQAERGHYPTVRNVFISGITSKGSKYGAFIDGLTDSTNVYNINVSNCDWDGVSEGGNLLRGLMRDVHFNNVRINGKEI
ncbi:MAG: glycoside hydrolase family 28 protein [Bacteroidaceae bacterium]|nr:glycoside hydrolase family 28 protein [Bacteroidaceae bacterium]